MKIRFTVKIFCQFFLIFIDSFFWELLFQIHLLACQLLIFASHLRILCVQHEMCPKIPLFILDHHTWWSKSADSDWTHTCAGFKLGVDMTVFIIPSLFVKNWWFLDSRISGWQISCLTLNHYCRSRATVTWVWINPYREIISIKVSCLTLGCFH